MLEWANEKQREDIESKLVDTNPRSQAANWDDDEAWDSFQDAMRSVS